MSNVIILKKRFEVGPLIWRASWWVSAKGWRTLRLQLAKESAIHVPRDEAGAVAVWLYDRALDAVSKVERLHGGRYRLRTTDQDLRRSAEVAVGIGDEATNRALTAVAARMGGADRFSITLDDGRRIWLDQSPGRGKWEVEGNLDSGGDLEAVADGIKRMMSDPFADEAHHEMTMAEFRDLGARLQRIEELVIRFIEGGGT